MPKTVYAVAICFFAVLASSAEADIVYKPINPSFGGDPFNSNHLQSLASSQNLHKPKSSSSQQSSSERFLAMLESRLYSALATKVSEAIFGDNSQQSGRVTFDDQDIYFNKTTTSIELIVTDLLTGKVTNIVIPNVQDQ